MWLLIIDQMNLRMMKRLRVGNPQEEERRLHEDIPIGIDFLFAFEYRNVVLSRGMQH